MKKNTAFFTPNDFCRISLRKIKAGFQILITLLLSFALVPFADASVFYKFDVIAKTGDAGLTGMGNAPSINDKGMVAFTGLLANGDGIFVGDGSILPTNITPGFVSTSRTFGSAVQINNAGKVVGRDRLAGSPPKTLIRIWDSAVPDSFTTIARGGGTSDPYDSVLTHSSINNDNTKLEDIAASGGNNDGICDSGESCIDRVVFSSFTGTFNFLATPILTPISISDSGLYNEISLNTPLRPQLADNGRVVVRAGSLSTDPIKLYDYNLGGAITIADASMGFTALGQSPGISDDGLVVVFYGELNSTGAAALKIDSGPGIFASIDEGGASRKIIKVTGRKVEDTTVTGGNKDGICDTSETCKPAAELGYDEIGGNRFFSGYDVNSRIAVTNLGLGGVGIDDDAFVVSFIGTPNAASRGNPTLPGGRPLFFTAQQGLWTIRIDVQQELSGAHNRVYNINTPIPVIQLNDVINGEAVSSIAVFDPIANAATNSVGVGRTQRRGDHRLAFWVQTSTGNMIIRASKLDSDQDGLLDHWETLGIDIDQDGVKDLDLAAMGANVINRDLFFEIDWLADQPDFKHEPAAGVISPLPPLVQTHLETMFRNAPKLSGVKYGIRSDGNPPDDIPAGINLHIDGGPGKDKVGQPLSRNMGGSLQGGDKIGMPADANAWVHVVYFGKPGTITLSGVNTRSFSEIKDNFFGINSKRARELAFKYVVFGSFHSFIETTPGSQIPFSGDIFLASNFPPTLTSATTLPLGPDGNLLAPGHAVLITNGPGSGQLRMIKKITSSTLELDKNWSVLPTSASTFTLLNGSSGLGEVSFQPANNYHGFPGNDFLVTLQGFGISGERLANECIQWRTFAHELGHTLGLRHGGIDHFAWKGGPPSEKGTYSGPDYLSLMSYSYQLWCPPSGVPLAPTDSYSSSSDLTFDDFSNLEHDFPNISFHLGNAFGSALGATVADAESEPEMTIDDVEKIFGPLDLEAPHVNITSPNSGSVIYSGATFTVAIAASDNRQLEKVFVEFDVNGNGQIDKPEESIEAINVGGVNYQAVFSGVSGNSGTREILAIATDAATNLETATVEVTVSSDIALVMVPNVVGLTQAAAETMISGIGLTIGTVTQQASSTVPAGSVISQNPAAGAQIASGSGVNLVVSSGPALITVPDVIGQTQTNAETALTGAGLSVGTVTQQASSTVPAGSVISQNPAAGAQIASGSAVNLVVSSGPALISVPNVVGQTQASAGAALTGAGLTIGTVTQQTSSTVPAGSVISQNPSAGTEIAPGSAVNLVVSSGPAQVFVPQLDGKTQAAAEAAIIAAGLTVGTVTQEKSSVIPEGFVLSQSPMYATSVAAGSAVDLVISLGSTTTTTGKVVRISKNISQNITYGNASSWTDWQSLKISADNRYVVFRSEATNLYSVPTSSGQIYVYDRNTDALELVSRQSASAGGAPANRGGGQPSISANNRYVAFCSGSTNLDSAATNGNGQVYVYDRDTDTLELVSRQSASAGGAVGNSFCEQTVSMSADGRYVAFQSHSTNLDSAFTTITGVQNGQVFVYDRNTDTLELVSRQSASAGGAPANSGISNASISADGRYVAFSSSATNLDPASTTSYGDVYVYDRDTDTLKLVSPTSNTVNGYVSSGGSVISANGRYVAFESSGQVYVYDRNTDTLELVSRQSASAGGAPANLGGSKPSISADGRYVAFSSDSYNLDPADAQVPSSAPWGKDIYVYDRQAHTVYLMSTNTNGTLGNLASNYPAISPDGTLLALSSRATNLDGPQLDWQAFVKETGLAPSVVNHSPIANAGPDQIKEATSPSGASVTLDGSGSSDPDTGDSIVSYAWSGPFGSATGQTATVTLPLGIHTATLTVTDGQGSMSTDTANITVQDTVPPSLTCPNNVSGTLGQTVNLGTPTVSDVVDPNPTLTNDAPASFGAGVTTVTWTATDHSKNSATCAQSVTLTNPTPTYVFQGFFPPVDNLPTVNTVKNGSTVPVKWRLLDAEGHYITDTATVVETKYLPSTCSGSMDAIEETVPTGGTLLRWDESDQQFIYNWKTPPLPGKCVRLDIKFNDGSTRSANFKLK